MNKPNEQNTGIGKSEPAQTGTPPSSETKQKPRETAQETAHQVMPKDAIKDPSKDPAKAPLQAGKHNGDGASQ